MQTIKIGGMKYPIVLVDSIADLDPEAIAIQCVAGIGEGMTAYFYRERIPFSAWDDTSMHAAEKVAFKIRRYEEDCKIFSVTIGSVNYPVRSRNTLWDETSKSERDAPIGMVHWWLKGFDGEEQYKCDIHFAEGDSSYSIEGVGKTLHEALENLVVFAEITLGDTDL